MACFAGVCSGRGHQPHTETIRAAGCEVESASTALRIRLLLAEAMFSKTPLSAASFPALAFRLGRCNISVLKGSLAMALAAHPMLAGRLRGREVALTNDGVPFTTCDGAGDSAPQDFEEGLLFQFADFRKPQRVRRGLEPLLTVKLTRFKDGSAVLAMCRCHGLLDGTSAWNFLADWAAAARGQALKSRTSADRAAIERLLPDETRIDELAMELFGKAPKKSWMGSAMEYATPPIATIWDGLFLSGLAFPNRPRLFFSDEEVSRIKTAATPAPGSAGDGCSAGDGWVSTQEALSAYILLTVCQAFLPTSSAGRALLVLLLDPRKALGLPATTCMGCGVTILGLRVTGILEMTLAEVANTIHEAAVSHASPEVVRKRWELLAGLGEKEMPFEAMQDLMKLRMQSDLTLQLNNQSKRSLPDFGEEGSGGPAQAVLTNAGPTLILPAQGGIEIFFCTSFLGSASGSRAVKALEALRSQIPEGAGPTLLRSKSGSKSSCR